MELTQENLKALQLKIQELRLKVDKLETSQFLIESERMKKNAYIQQLKQEIKEWKAEVQRLDDRLSEEGY